MSTSDFDTPLDCDGVAAALADYLDDDASDALRAAVELHASSCASCGQLLADLVAIRHDAAALPLLVPSRDLWDGIAERIDAPVVPLDSTRAARVVSLRRRWLRPALAAAALVTITAGVTHYMTRAALSPVAPSTQVATTSSVPASVAPAAIPNVDSTSSATPATSGSAPATTGRRTIATTSPSSTQSAPARTGSPTSSGSATSSARLASTAPQPNAVDPLYVGEIRTLRKIVRERRTQLDPATVAVLEQSLAVIDSAIAQSRAALAKDPASGFLATQLNRSLDKKVELLRTVASLPART
jgi:hypothetical protein